MEGGWWLVVSRTMIGLEVVVYVGWGLGKIVAHGGWLVVGCC